MSEWPEGIHPLVGGDRRQQIKDARAARASELERFEKGAGIAYLLSMGVPRERAKAIVS